MVKNLIAAVTAVLLLAGCAGSSVPKWYSKHKMDTPEYIYGAGEGTTKLDAINNALSFAASKVSVTIDSTFATSKEYIQTNDKSNVFKQLSKQTTSRVKDIEFSDYSVEKLSKDDGRYYALVKINRTKNARMLYSKAINDIKTVEPYLSLTDRVQVFTKYPKLLSRIKKDIYNLYIAESLKSLPGIDEAVKKAANIKIALENRLQKLSFNAAVRDSRLKAILEEVFSNLGYSISEKGIRVEAVSHEENRKIGGYYYTFMSLDVVLKDKTSVQFNVKCAGKSISDFKTARELALQECKRKLDYKIKSISGY